MNSDGLPELPEYLSRPVSAMGVQARIRRRRNARRVKAVGLLAAGLAVAVGLGIAIGGPEGSPDVTPPVVETPSNVGEVEQPAEPVAVGVPTDEPEVVPHDPPQLPAPIQVSAAQSHDEAAEELIKLAEAFGAEYLYVSKSGSGAIEFSVRLGPGAGMGNLGAALDLLLTRFSIVEVKIEFGELAQCLLAQPVTP